MSEVMVGDRVRITGRPDLTGVVALLDGAYLWVDIHGQQEAWMLPRGAVEVLDEWEDLAAEIHRVMSKPNATHADIIRTVRTYQTGRESA